MLRRLCSCIGVWFVLVGCGSPPAGPDDSGVREDVAQGECAGDSQCDDGFFCNGIELCSPSDPEADARGCAPAAIEPCTASQRCDEAADDCRTICSVAVDADGDGHRALECGGDDCDDSEPNVYPGNVEVCDAEDLDEDCDPGTFGVRDLDGDEHPDASCCNRNSRGELFCGTDCDDAVPGVHPGLPEVCDEVDNDCDGAIDEGAALEFYQDRDGDGFGAPESVTATACAAPPGYSRLATDCDDALPQRNPAAPEVCDGLDNDCDGDVDEGLETEYFLDADGDGFGDAAAPTRSACSRPSGYVLLTGDCDDTRAARNPGAPEVCDALDNDCDGEVDEGARATTWYRDADGDGFGAAASGTTESCSPVAGYSLLSTDCNDAQPSVHPGAGEGCDAVDTDCDGLLGEAIEDDDRDGFADTVCVGFAGRGTDCDDANAAVWPGAPERCDRIDNDCSSGGGTDLTEDIDGDGFAPRSATCSGGYPALDCDDTRESVRPGAAEVCNGYDDDCNGTVDDPAIAVLSCTLDHATPACVGGRCTIGSCDGSFRDCDAIATNGCEIDTSTALAHCGACGRACNVINGAGLCSAGTCAIASCETGYADCDAIVSTGCEVSLRTLSSCGACGRACALDHASETCVTGACALTSCDTQYADCDANPSTGCEASLTTLSDCGACARPCALANASASCGTGTCTLGACDTGFANCDGLEESGCEIELATNPAHCGACGARCTAAGATCAASICHPRLGWYRVIGDRGNDFIEAVAVDDSGNVYVAGSFERTVDFGGTTQTARGTSADAYIASYTASGALRWVRSIGSDGADGMGALAVRGGRLIASGGVAGSVDFGDGAPSSASPATFVASYDPTTGAYGWHRAFVTGGGASLSVNDLTLDAAGGTYLGGHVTGTIDFGTGPLTALSSDGIVVRLGPAGATDFARQYGSARGPVDIHSIEVDAAGNTYLGGSFFDEIVLGGSTFTAVDVGVDGFIASYDPSGAHRWSFAFGSPARPDFARDLRVDAVGNLVAVGEGGGDLGGGVLSAGFFVVSLNRLTGGHRWSSRYSGNGYAVSVVGADLQIFGLTTSSLFAAPVTGGIATARVSPADGALSWGESPIRGGLAYWRGGGVDAAGRVIVGAALDGSTRLSDGTLVTPAGSDGLLVQLLP